MSDERTAPAAAEEPSSTVLGVELSEDAELDACGVSPSAPPNVGRRKRSLLKRIGIGVLVVVGVLALLAGVAYAFGGPVRVDAGDAAAYEAAVPAAQQVPKQFVIGIPGCVCHSSDPVMRGWHERYRMRDCMKAGCHG